MSAVIAFFWQEEATRGALHSLRTAGVVVVRAEAERTSVTGSIMRQEDGLGVKGAARR